MYESLLIGSLMICVLFLALTVSLLFVVRWQKRDLKQLRVHHQIEIERMSSTFQESSSQMTRLMDMTSRGQLDLIDKSLALVSTTDPLAFQAVQVMAAPSSYDEGARDPSDEGEQERIRQTNPDLADREDELSGFENSILDGFSPVF